jgi:hypothetical protein
MAVSYVMRHVNVITVTENLCRFSLNGDNVAYCVENKLLDTRARFDQCHTDCCVDVTAVVFTNKRLFRLILGVSDVKINETYGTAMCNRIYRVYQEEWARLRQGVPYFKLYRYNPKPK